MLSEYCTTRGVQIIGVMALLVALTGCKHRHNDLRSRQDNYAPSSPMVASSPMMMARVAGLSASRKSGQGSIAYTHSLTLTVSNHLVGAHLAALRDSCSRSEGCELLSANENADERLSGTVQSFARISVRLPHDQVEPFLKVASSPLGGEKKSNVITREAETNETDLHADVIDVDRRLAQMTAYRDRLEALEAQSAGHTDDLIKVAKELSEAQSSLEAAQKEKNSLTRRIDTEEVNVTYQGAQATITPLRARWRETSQVFMETLGDVWFFLIQLVVWAPLGIVALLVVRRAIKKGWFSRM